MAANANEKRKSVDKKQVRRFPNNFEAEQSLLCCMLIDSDAAREVLSVLPEDGFYNTVNRNVYSAMRTLYKKGDAVDFINVYDAMQSAGTADDTTLDYLTTLNNLFPSAVHYKQYKKILVRDMVLRNVIKAGESIIDEAYENSDEDEVIRKAEKLVYDLSKDMRTGGLVHVSDPAAEVLNRIDTLMSDSGALRGLNTGFRRFDKVTNGLQNGNLIILAARPSVGKTAFALNIVANTVKNSKTPKCIAVFSLEMASREIAQRLISNMGGISMNDMNSASFRGDGQTRLWKVIKTLSETKIYINDSSLITPQEVLSQCRKLSAEQPSGRVDLVVVDYLQLMSSGSSTRGEDNRQQEIARMSRLMKVIARELNCPVILLSQMSRGIERRETKTPQLSDLRESGAIEQDADIVMFLYREFEEEKHASPIILDLQKHRNGELARIRLSWQGEIMTFTESDDQHEPVASAKPRKSQPREEETEE